MSAQPGLGWLHALQRRLTGELGGPQLQHPAAAEGLDVGRLAPQLAHVLTLPDNPPAMHALAGGNFQVGAQPERAHAVVRGFSVTGPYALAGDLPLPPIAADRLTESPEQYHRLHPFQVPRQLLPLGPTGGMMPLKRE